MYVDSFEIFLIVVGCHYAARPSMCHIFEVTIIKFIFMHICT